MKKAITILLGITMTAALLAGCGSTAETTQAPAAETAVEETAEAPAEEATEEVTEEVFLKVNSSLADFRHEAKLSS